VFSAIVVVGIIILVVVVALQASQNDDAMERAMKSEEGNIGVWIIFQETISI